jgi:superfamily I DNA/RNA helicase
MTHALESTVTFSPQQQFIFDEIPVTTGNSIIIAVAGSGKTFTLLELVKRLENELALVAYNSAIAKELKSKIALIRHFLKADVEAGTCHTYGKYVLDKFAPNSKLLDGKDIHWSKRKIHILMQTTKDPNTGETGVPVIHRKFVQKMYGLAREWGAGILEEFEFKNKEKWLDLIERYDVDELYADARGKKPFNLDQLVTVGIRWTIYIIREGLKRIQEMHDFTDMLYVPLFLHMKQPDVLPFWKYKWVLVDEAQDLNPLRRLLIKCILHPEGRVVFVGDPHQAIYGFTGANFDSLDIIKRDFQCTEYPLTYSWRCAKKIVEYAHRWVTHIQAAPNAPDGEVIENLPESEMWSYDLTYKDAILCRNNAPLIQLFFKLLNFGIASHIEGKDIGTDLIGIVEKFRVKNLYVLKQKVEEEQYRLVKKHEDAKNGQKASEVQDQYDCILALIDSMPQNTTADDLAAKIRGMFKDTAGNDKPTLTLTSIHKSKGREWDRVFWYGQNLYNPSPYAKKPEEKQQEKNLCYVAATRAKTTLIDVLAEDSKRRKRI